MLGRIANLVRKDIAKSLRDNIVLYVLLSPMLLAAGLALYLPSVETMSLTFALDAAAEPRVIEAFKGYGKVEVYETRRDLAGRVERLDDVAGVVRRDEEGAQGEEGEKGEKGEKGGPYTAYVVLVEGNEASDVGAATAAVLDRVVAARQLAEVERVSLGRTSPMLREMAAGLSVFGAILIAGVLIGFAIVDERETGAIRALAVSPATMFEFAASQVATAAAVSVVVAVATSLMLVGTAADYVRIVVGVLCAMVLSIVFGFLVGGLADDQIAGIAVLKVVMLPFIGIPIASLFVGARHQWVFYPFPNYWGFEIFRDIFAGESTLGFWGSCAATVLFGGAIVAGLAPALLRRLRLR